MSDQIPAIFLQMCYVTDAGIFLLHFYFFSPPSAPPPSPQLQLAYIYQNISLCGAHGSLVLSPNSPLILPYTPPTLANHPNLNNNASLNGKNFHSFFQNLNDGNDLPIPTISSRFYDVPLLISNFSKSTKPILASLNIQSLMSKHSELKDFLYELSANKVPAYIIALQETWTIHHPHLINIPGYKFIHQHRKDMKGGGVGFYVKENLSFKVSEKHTTFIPKIFECLSIEISISNKKNHFLIHL